MCNSSRSRSWDSRSNEGWGPSSIRDAWQNDTWMTPPERRSTHKERRWPDGRVGPTALPTPRDAEAELVSYLVRHPRLPLNPHHQNSDPSPPSPDRLPRPPPPHLPDSPLSACLPCESFAFHGRAAIPSGAGDLGNEGG